ncbi:hypothetical protein FNV43_RR15311 [Rhamnella rubrinervis]|uniref:Uncharacterized protein n=1 Tax=Rhamnella rubrinervis TaxID=2594499 RepID=A0A8K0ECN0_9ROSA|nr:hypothetical protein FNV43_RR15311 [Rhamnella rubrinervis]
MLGQESEGSNKSMEKRDHKAGEEEEKGGARFGDGFSWGSDGFWWGTWCWVLPPWHGAGFGMTAKHYA